MFLQTVVDIESNIKGSDSVVKIFDLGRFIGVLAGTILIVAAVASFGYMVYGGLRWVLAGGEKGKIDEARQMITQSIIGLAVTASTFAMFSIIQFILGINLVTVPFGRSSRQGSSDSSVQHRSGSSTNAKELTIVDHQDEQKNEKSEIKKNDLPKDWGIKAKEVILSALKRIGVESGDK